GLFDVLTRKYREREDSNHPNDEDRCHVIRFPDHSGQARSTVAERRRARNPTATARTETGPERTSADDPDGRAEQRRSLGLEPTGRIPHHRSGRTAARYESLAEGRIAGPGPVAGPPSAGEDHSFRS